MKQNNIFKPTLKFSEKTSVLECEYIECEYIECEYIEC